MMKKYIFKTIFAVFFLLLSFPFLSINASSNLKHVNIKVEGVKDIVYQIGFCLTGHDIFQDSIEQTPLTSYHDSEGYIYSGSKMSFTTQSNYEFDIEDDTFKIAILTSNNVLLVTPSLNAYGNKTYYKIIVSEELTNKTEDEATPYVILSSSDIIKESTSKVEILKAVLRILIVVLFTWITLSYFKITSNKIHSIILLVHTFIYFSLNTIVSIINFYNGFDYASNWFILLSIILIILLLLVNIFIMKSRLKLANTNFLIYLIVINLLPFVINFIFLLILG